MKYLIYGNEQDAKSRSEEIATDQGCSSNKTKYWFDWVISHNNPPATAMIIPDNQADKLNFAESSLLQTRTQMEDRNWFPPRSIS